MLTLVAFGCAALGGLARPTSARAECPYIAIPSATGAARSAGELFVGTVVENIDDQLFDFRIRIDHVIRGRARVGDLRRIDFVFPGWPYARAADGTTFPPCEAIPGWTGNVMAIALEARAPDGTGYNAASWISGSLPINRELPRTSLAAIEAAAGMPSTDTEILTRRAQVFDVTAILLLVSAGSLIIGLRRFGPDGADRFATARATEERRG